MSEVNFYKINVFFAFFSIPELGIVLNFLHILLPQSHAMPELPEVESSRLALSQRALRRSLSHMDTTEGGGHARSGERDELVLNDNVTQGALVGFRLEETGRKGKHMWLKFVNGKETKFLVLHFGMTGWLWFKGKMDATTTLHRNCKAMEHDSDEPWPPKYTKLVLGFDGGKVMVAFTDPRRLGRVEVTDDPREKLEGLADDPVESMPSIEEFTELVQCAGTREIKSVLLDQGAIVCGIGNYLADEILHLARIHPSTRVSALDTADIIALRDAIASSCKIAIDCLVKEVDFPPEWLFHGRWSRGKKEHPIKGRSLSETKVGGRTTLFEPALQKMKSSKPKSSSLKKTTKAASSSGVKRARGGGE